MISLQISLLQLFVSKKTACEHEHDDLNMCKDYYSSSREGLLCCSCMLLGMSDDNHINRHRLNFIKRRLQHKAGLYISV